MRHSRFGTSEYQPAEGDVKVKASGAVTAGDFVCWVTDLKFTSVLRADSDASGATPTFAGVAMTTAADGDELVVRTVGYVPSANVATGAAGAITWSTTAGRAAAVSWSLTGDVQTIALGPIWGWVMDTASSNEAPVYLLRLPHGR
jgi:hypothetical protein